MKRWLCAVMLVGCHSAPTTTPLGNQPHESVPIVRFAIGNGHTVQILRTSDAGLVVERTVNVPVGISRLVWGGSDPAVWLDLAGDWRGPGFPGEDMSFDGPPRVTGPHENEMGLVTANGYVKFPSIKWPTVPKPGDDNFGDLAKEVTDENAVLHASKDGIWQERCFWFGGPDGGWCLTSKFVRRAPAPIVFADALPDQPPVHKWPTVAASPTIRLSIEKRLRHPEEPDMAAWENEQERLRCVENGGADSVYPDDIELGMNERVEWISTEPPIFRAVGNYVYAGVGKGRPPEYVIFEGCKPSRRYTNAVVGPHDVIALYGSELSIQWHGREIGHHDGGSEVAFAAP